MAESDFHDIFPHGEDTTPYRKLTGDYVSAANLDGERIVKVDPKALTLLAQQGFVDCQHLLRPAISSSCATSSTTTRPRTTTASSPSTS